MSWKQHMSTQDTKGEEVKDNVLFVIHKNILYISSFLNFCFFLSVMETELKKKYCNVTQQVIDLFLALCEECQLKKKAPKWELVVRPILSHYMKSRCQVDLNDMQSEPDGYYRFITNYQDHFTKFTILHPLKSKTTKEVAYQLMDIFCMFSAPLILNSDMATNLRTK